MYSVTRNADDKPAGMLRVQIDAPAPADMKDPPFGLGGTFYFEPGQTEVMQEHSARVIMEDPALGKRFTVDPALPVREAETAKDDEVIPEHLAPLFDTQGEIIPTPPSAPVPVMPADAPKPAPAIKAKK